MVVIEGVLRTTLYIIYILPSVLSSFVLVVFHFLHWPHRSSFRFLADRLINLNKGLLSTAPTVLHSAAALVLVFLQRIAALL